MKVSTLFDNRGQALAEARARLHGRIHVPKTAETRGRHQLLKAKKKGDCWEEDGRLYRMGPNGVTAFKKDWF